MHLPLLQRNISGGHGTLEAAIELLPALSPIRPPVKMLKEEEGNVRIDIANETS